MTTREKAEQLFVNIMAGRLTSNAAIDELLAFAAKERADALEDVERRLAAMGLGIYWLEAIRSLKGAPEAGHPRPSPSPQQHEGKDTK